MSLDGTEWFVVESTADAPMRPRALLPTYAEAVAYGRERFGESAHIRATMAVLMDANELRYANDEIDRVMDLESKIRNLQSEFDEALS